MLATAPARADDYTDLLDILRAKGSLTSGEYSTLLAKHRHPNRAARRAHAESTAPEETTDANVAAAQQAAASAAASAAAAQAAATSTQVALKDPLIVRTEPYVPTKGITLKAGGIDINISGFINGFYTFNSPGKGTPVAGGLSSGSNSGFDSSSVRNGLLPGALLFKMSTTQDDIDLTAFFGMYPGLNNTAVGALNANNGGEPVALGTAGIDFRQAFVTVGTKTFGTVKIGRDLALFGSDAILDDATLLSVGSTGSNSAPGNTSLGRIGVGYVYADWIPQITYSTPIMSGFQVDAGVFQPLDEFSFSGLSAGSDQHNTPMFQGKLTYDFDTMGFKGRAWASGLVQPQQHVTSELIDNPNHKITAVAGEAGVKVDYNIFGGVVYYYRGSGLGSTALFFDGVAENGRKRDSEGGYVQGYVKVMPKLKLVGSYGMSNLYQAPGEDDPLLVRRNESEIGAGYYTLTDWMTLVAEYAHTTAHAHGGDKANDNTFSLGTILFF